MIAGPTILNRAWQTGIAVIILLFACSSLRAQQGWPVKVFKVKDNRMWIVLSQDLSSKIVDSFITKFNLRDIGLARFMQLGNDDSLRQQGWTVKKENKLYVITKPLGSLEPTVYPGGKVIFTPVPTNENWREVGGNRTTYGFNQFQNGEEFRREGNVVYFFLKGFEDEKRVRLAGNFTDWQHSAFPMTQTKDGWVAPVKLEPGQYYYKFIIDDNDWTTDPQNLVSENDGRGNENSVYFVPNYSFFLEGHLDAEEVFLVGTFNNWADDEIPMQKTEKGWSIEMYIEEGTYSYHYMVDGKKVKPEKTEQEKLAIGKPYLFKLKGFNDAKKVSVAGNFNDWNKDELYMKKTSEGWELRYVLGPGNYQYKFIVDGNWMTDPENPDIVKDKKRNENSFKVIGPNYTFKLKGYAEAKDVFVTGDFNDYSPEGLRMERSDDAWIARVYLAKGKHKYKFIVDGKVIHDPGNKAWERGEEGMNSVIWIDPNEPSW